MVAQRSRSVWHKDCVCGRGLRSVHGVARLSTAGRSLCRGCSLRIQGDEFLHRDRGADGRRAHRHGGRNAVRQRSIASAERNARLSCIAVRLLHTGVRDGVERYVGETCAGRRADCNELSHWQPVPMHWIRADHSGGTYRARHRAAFRGASIFGYVCSG